MSLCFGMRAVVSFRGYVHFTARHVVLGDACVSFPQPVAALVGRADRKTTTYGHSIDTPERRFQPYSLW